MCTNLACLGADLPVARGRSTARARRGAYAPPLSAPRRPGYSAAVNLVPADPALALRWLALARRGIVVTQVLLLAAARIGADVHVALPVPLVLVLTTLVGLDLAAQRVREDARAVAVLVALDLLALTTILLLTGGAQNPLQAFYLVEVALLAIVLPARASWVATAGVLVLQGVAAMSSAPVPGLDDTPHHHAGHLVGHILAFDLAAVAVTGFVGHMTAQLREKEEALRVRETERAERERLAALGSLAAGTAHALGTPLGAIELLAEEMAVDLPLGAAGRAAHPELVAQVRRCRAILDRMLAGEAGAGGRTARVGEQVAEWVSAWRGVHMDVTVTSDIPPLDVAIAGAPEGWRDATWTVLDNARTAGGPIHVTLGRDGRVLHLSVDDHGPAVSAAQLARAGQPFFSAWPSRKGAGLGLYVARSFAQATGGDLDLIARAGGGVQVTLTMIPEGAP